MTAELLFVLLLLLATIVMFAYDRPRMDAVAILVMTVLPFTGVITVSEALSALSDPNIVLIGALFVIGEGLVRTGVAQRMGDFLARRAGQSETKLIALLMTVVAGVGSVMSSTGVVAIFIPAALRIARRARIAPGRLMMPLSVAALISGMMTLIATAPNLVVHSQLIRAGYEGFGFFAFTVFGVPVLIVAIGYMLLTRRTLSPQAAPDDGAGTRRRVSQWIEEYGIAKNERRVLLEDDSPWVGKRLEELDLRSLHGIDILAIERQRRFSTAIIEPAAQTRLRAGDVLFLSLRERTTDANDLFSRFRLTELPLAADYFADASQAVGMVELLVPPTSRLIGETVITARFRSLHKLTVIGIRRGNAPIAQSAQDEPLRLGDTLLAAGPWRAIKRLKSDSSELIVLNVPTELDDVIPLPSRAPAAVLTLAAVVAMMVTGVVPNVQAALIGCLLLGVFKCIDMNAAYRSIQWQTLFLIVGMMPFSIALERTGGVELAVRALIGAVGEMGPTVTLTCIYALTVLLGLFISNTATAVLMAPVALALASELGLSPYPFAMIVALASSSSFITPVSSPVNALVVGPGGYRFVDFVRVGLPLALLVMVVNVLLVRALLPV